MNRVEAAVAQFAKGYSCSQAVLSAHSADFGLDPDTALRLAAAFGGGMGRTAQTCGAVTGALMVIGLKYGSTEADDREAKERTYARVRDFLTRFQKRNGSAVCRELLDCDISTPEGLDFARQHDLITTLCPHFVRSAAEILEEML